MRVGLVIRRRAGRIAVGLYSATISALLILSITPTAACDILHLQNGGTVEGEILQQDGEAYHVRTVVGTVTLPAKAVKRVEPCASPWQEYEQKRRELRDTPAEHIGLARWCEQRGLTAERLQHLELALRLDLDYEPARRQLGFVKVGDMWVEGRTVVERDRPTTARAEVAVEGAADREDEKIVAAIQGSWRRQIRTIKRSAADGPRWQAARERVLQIRDPLAILPLVQELGSGPRPCRELLVDALRNFDQDEATLNLAVLALVDRDETVRAKTLAELVRRNDPRVVAQFRQALRSDSEWVVRRAATGLGKLEAREAVGELIEMLITQRRKMVEVPVRHYFHQMPATFNGPTRTYIGESARVVHWPEIGFIDSIGLFPVYTELRMQDVTVFRTEVLEALRHITEQDFGFDTTAWERWHEEHKS
ncbi:MAG: HEAT repeat domain-containing protein [Planctomycetes bacterium]|nr:HEAT repeat domain-containing protein [Planctomycetota bacterium]